MKLYRVSGSSSCSERSRLWLRVSGLKSVTFVSVWLSRKLKLVFPPSCGGVQVAMTSSAAVLVAKSLVKKRKVLRVGGAGDTFGDQVVNLLRRQIEELSQGQAIVHVDAEEVCGECEWSPLQDSAKGKIQ